MANYSKLYHVFPLPKILDSDRSIALPASQVRRYGMVRADTLEDQKIQSTFEWDAGRAERSAGRDVGVRTTRSSRSKQLRSSQNAQRPAKALTKYSK